MTKWFEMTDSTNNQIACDKESLDNKSVYATDFQTAGKGQRGNHWVSETGENMLFSILFKPENIKSSDQFIVSQAVSLGITSYLDSKDIKAKIKWPNDIYVGDKKICGILIENTISGDILSYSIVGIGLNCNQETFEGAPNPTSIFNETGVKIDIKSELNTLLEHIFKYYDEIVSASASIESLFLSRMYRKDEIHRYIDLNDGKEFKGIIRGVDKSARLLIETTDGSSKCFAFKEIAYVLE